MNIESYLTLKQKIIDRGYGSEIDWADGLTPCQNPEDFFLEYMWVVLNSGMKNQIARKIQSKILDAWEHGYPTNSAFGHKGKVGAIDFVRENYRKLFGEYLDSENKIEYLKSLPWIGDITKYHLAKNLGFDCCKPDRHLVRIAKSYNTTPDDLCKKLADETGDRVATVDLVIWRAANLGII